MLEVKFNPSSKAVLVGGVHLVLFQQLRFEPGLGHTHPLSLTVDPLSNFNKGGGVRALSTAWGWQLTAPLPLTRRLSTQNRSRPEDSSTARYSEEVK